MFLSFVICFIFARATKQFKLQSTPTDDAQHKSPKSASPFGLRIDARTLTKENFRTFYDGKYPVILTNVFDIKNELWTDELLSTLGEGEIEYDVRHSSDGSIESYQATLNEFVSSLSENSDHDENMYLMNEDLFTNETKLLDFLKGSNSLFGDDLFEHFPESIRPYQALIIGGVGARSFLHCDPYEWMGINYLFEGRKLWTFLSPDVPASLFEARRNAPDAWGAYNISAGWVSDMDLYRHRQNFVLGALASSQMKRAGDEGKKGDKKGDKKGGKTSGLEKISSSSLNKKWLETAISEASDRKEGIVSDSGDKNLNVPIFLSGVDAVDYCEDSRFAEGALQLVQEEGDLILIPPRFWHQVYHLEPSIALASQYINDVGKDRTFKHILKWCSGIDTDRITDRGTDGEADDSLLSLLPKDFESLSEIEQVLTVIKIGLRTQHGRIKGSALMRKLLYDKVTAKEDKDEL